MKTWAVIDGDLQIGHQGLAEVTGADKVLQDLKIATLEPFGCDRFHPRWGSLLYRMIGQVNSPDVSQLVRSEIIRLVNNYMLIQSEVLRNSRNAGQRPTYSNADLVQSIESIDVAQDQDRLVLLVTIKTVSGQTVTLDSQVAA